MRRSPWILGAIGLFLACAGDDGDTQGESSGATTTSAGATTTSAGATSTSAGATSTSAGATSTGATSTGATATSTTTSASASESDSTSESTQGSTGVVPDPCEGDAPRIRITTSLGDLVVQVDAVNRPVTVANFIHYVESGFYVDTIFHRVIDGFVIQGGGFTAGLASKPTDPPIPLEIDPPLSHGDGAIAMARTNVPDSATSQFYLCDGPQPGLDGAYSVFGALVEGFDVLHAISSVAVHNVGDFQDVPVDDVMILEVACE